MALPRHVEDEVEGYLNCGDPARGFAWLECEGCASHRLIPFSCKGRGFCPSCAGRRMAEGSLRWAELFPPVRVRQFVLTVPYGRRLLIARDRALERGVHATAMGCIERWYGTATGGGQTGSVSVTQRFGSSLRLNPHFHVLFVDGGYVRGKEGGVRFRPARAHPSDVEALIVEIATACEAWLARQGHGPEDAAEEADDEGMRLFQAAAVAGYSVVRGAPTRVARRVQRIGGRERELPPLCASCDGWNLHAGVVVEAEDREGLLRLGRYLLDTVGRTPAGRGPLGGGAGWAGSLHDEADFRGWNGGPLLHRRGACVPAGGADPSAPGEHDRLPRGLRRERVLAVGGGRRGPRQGKTDDSLPAAAAAEGAAEKQAPPAFLGRDPLSGVRGRWLAVPGLWLPHDAARRVRRRPDDEPSAREPASKRGGLPGPTRCRGVRAMTGGRVCRGTGARALAGHPRSGKRRPLGAVPREGDGSGDLW